MERRPVPRAVTGAFALATSLAVLTGYASQSSADVSPYENNLTQPLPSDSPSPTENLALSPSPEASPTSISLPTQAESPVASPSASSESSTPNTPSPSPISAPIPIISHTQVKKHWVIDGHGADVFIPGTDKPRKLVIMLHRLYSDPLHTEAETGLLAAASTNKWLMIYPNGYEHSWNGGRCCGPARDTNQQDTEFLADTISFAKKRHALAENVPIIMAGVSNGAMLAARFICTHPGIVDGAILDSGNLQYPCKVVRVPNLLMIRGENDHVVPINGRAYSNELKTSLLPDSFLLNAFRYGSKGRLINSYNRGGVRSFVARYGADGRLLKVVRHQGGHGWNNKAGPGEPSDPKLATGFIQGVVAH